MWLQARMYLLIALLFGILYGVITGLGTWMGAGSAITYLIIGFGFLLIQYLVSPALVGWPMKIKWVTEKEAPELHHMATALYKLVYGNTRMRNSEELRRVEGVKAFFVNDPSRSYCEIKELSQIDLDMSGTIEYDELMELRQKEVKLSKSQKLMEIFTTHPNMLKRIKHLSTLAV